MRLSRDDIYEIVNRKIEGIDKEEYLNKILIFHRKREVRARAAQELGNLAHLRNIIPLLRALSDKSMIVRRAVALTCGYHKVTEAVQPLVDWLEITYLDQKSYIVIVRVLGMLQDPIAIKPLIRFAARSRAQKLLDSSMAVSIATSLGWLQMIKNIPNINLPHRAL